MIDSSPLRPRPGTGALGGPLVHLCVTGSTNDRAIALARAGAPAGTVVVAEQQTAGRGRQGRSWSAPAGRALTLSLVVRGTPAKLETLPIAGALAVCEACEDVAAVRCAIKWPNDVWIEGRKVAGILIESRPQERWAAVGIGLNVGTAVDELEPELRERATSLRIATGAPVDRERALDALLDRLARRLAATAGGDTTPLLRDYRARDALSGARVAWREGDARIAGDARGIDEHGNLVVFTDAGERLALASGEVHLEREPGR